MTPAAGPGGSRQPQWRAFDSGLGRQIRTDWRHDPDAAEPSPEAVEQLREKTGQLRLDEAFAVGGQDRNRRYVLLVIQGLIALTLLGQRLTLPFGENGIPLPLVISYLALLLLLVRGGMVTNRVRTELCVTALTALVVAAWLASWIGNDVSINSVLLLVLLYLPWMFCVAPRYRDLFVPAATTFVRFMVGFALLGAGQMVAQLLLGWRYQDFVQDVFGQKFIAQSFNTANQISYTNTTIKANAFFFLEPSFLCQFCALALILALLLRAPAWQPLTLGLGMAATLSGTGILLLVFGVALLVLLAPNRIRPNYVIAGSVCLIIVFLTPAATILLDRRDETSQQGSSGYLRFVQPYTEVVANLGQHPSRYLVGAGPGSSDRLLTSGRFGAEAVVYTIVPKLAFEYGLIAMVAFMAFLLVAVLRGPPVPVLAASGLFMVNLLSGSLLQPHTIVTLWFLTSIWGAPVTVGVSDRLAALRRVRASGRTTSG